VDRAAKAELVTTMHSVFKDTGLVVVAHNKGMVAAQSAEFRKKVKEAGGTVRVVKNNLAKIALKDTEFAGITSLFKGPTILAYSKDPIAAAKAAQAYAKGNDKFVILGGSMGRTILDAQGVKTLAELPSLDELRAKIIGLLNAPATKIARTVAEPGAKLARVIQAKAAQVSEPQPS
jgi:large subunit ribosomal protein L10